MISSRFRVLLAEREIREGRRISLRDIARDTGVSAYTIGALADNTLREIPLEALDRLCTYLPCKVGDLLVHEPTPGQERLIEEHNSAQLVATL